MKKIEKNLTAISKANSYLLQYISLIEQGKIVVCKKLWKWLKILEKDIESDQWTYDLNRGQKPIRYIEKYCRHSKGEWSGKPLLLHISQKAYFEAKYGFINKNGFRRFRESIKFVAKKNGKSTEAAAEALYLSSGDGEMGAEVFLAANGLEGTKPIFIEAYRMTVQNPLFNGHGNNKTGLYHKVHSTLECKDYFSFIQALAVNPGALDGKNVHGVLQDEVHASNRLMYDILSPGVSSRDQAMYSMYTTMGFTRFELCDDMYDYSEDIINGLINDPSFFPWICEQDSEAEIYMPKMWQKSNPLLGIAKKKEYLDRKIIQMRNSPKAYALHATKDFNIPKNAPESHMQIDDYEDKGTFDIGILENNYAIIGVDLSRVKDLTSVVAIIYKPSTGKTYVLHKSFMPSETIDDRTKDEKLPFRTWEQKGFIDGSGTKVVLHADVTNWILMLKKKYKIYPFFTGYDRALSSYWTEEMKKKVYPRNHDEQLIPIPQGPITFNEPMQMLKADLQEGKVIYNDDKVLMWAFGNVAEKEDDGGNIGPNKKKAKKKRIDPYMALLNAYTIFYGKNRDRYLSLQGDK